MKLVVMIFTLGALVGCASSSNQVLVPSQLLHDELFIPHDPFEIESEQQIFALSPAAQNFLDKHVLRYSDFDKRAQALTAAVFDSDFINLSYAPEANTVAADTFLNKQANCLSMTILAYSMAKYAGIVAEFQEIDIPENWIMRDELPFLNGHINLLLKPHSSHENYKTLNVTRFFSKAILLDFNLDSTPNKFSKKTVSKQRVLAMFYNNKGGDWLAQGDTQRAYQYFKKAVKADSTFLPAWTNIGVTYRFANHLDYVEPVYKYVLQQDKENWNALENLSVLKKAQGKYEEANEIAILLGNKRSSNPYYHYILGEQDYARNNWLKAISHYQRAVNLRANIHEFYFGLAKTWYQLGDFEKSHKYLQKAKVKSVDAHTKDRYQHKLDLLGRL